MVVKVVLRLLSLSTTWRSKRLFTFFDSDVAYNGALSGKGKKKKKGKKNHCYTAGIFKKTELF